MNKVLIEVLVTVVTMATEVAIKELGSKKR